MTLKLAVTVGASVTTTRADAAALLSTVVLVDPAVWDPGTVLGSGVGAAGTRDLPWDRRKVRSDRILPPFFENLTMHPP